MTGWTGFISVAFIFFSIPSLCHSALAQQTDPFEYRARVAAEVKPYLSDCTAAFTNHGNVYDPDGVAACKVDQTEFAEEYFDALEGNEDDKFDVGFMFQRGDQYGVKYNPTMACAWWLETASTGGRTVSTIFDKALANACSKSPEVVVEANALYAEEQRFSKLTY